MILPWPDSLAVFIAGLLHGQVFNILIKSYFENSLKSSSLSISTHEPAHGHKDLNSTYPIGVIDMRFVNTFEFFLHPP